MCTFVDTEKKFLLLLFHLIDLIYIPKPNDFFVLQIAPINFAMHGVPLT